MYTKTAKSMKYAAIIPARNEEKHIEKTLTALKNQTIPPTQIIVVDDGSRDKTHQIASKYTEDIVRLPDRGYNAVGNTPELSRVFNHGLNRVKEDANYVLICGADNILPEVFFETIYRKMQVNPKLVIASGRPRGEPYSEHSPRGSRVVDAQFWRDVSGLQYPVAWGWEDWLYFKALQGGYEAKCFHDIVTQPQRPILTSARAGKARLWGKAMYALGYHWRYALGRIALTFFKNPKAGINMFFGWFLHGDVQKLDVADWVNQRQKNQFWKRVWSIVKHGGRK